MKTKIMENITIANVIREKVKELNAILDVANKNGLEVKFNYCSIPSLAHEEGDVSHLKIDVRISKSL